jgi:excisionase family DNA binding protein
MATDNYGILDLGSGPGAAPEQPTAPARLLTPGEVAARLGVQPSWVNKAARTNRIPHVRVGRYRRFRWPDIEEWLERQHSDA